MNGGTGLAMHLGLVRTALLWLLLAGLADTASLSSTVSAEEPAVVETPTEPASPATPLPSRQEAVALRYARFENSLNQLAEHLRKTDPDRANLLFRAIGKSKEGRISDQLKQVVDLLKKEQLGDALDGQQSAVEQMLLVLQLLQSEDRKDEIERERQRIAGLIKDVDKLVLKQTDVRAATERNSNAENLKDKQQQISDATQKVLDKIDQQDAERNGKSSDSAGKSKSTPQPANKEGDDPKDPLKDKDDASPSPEEDGSKPSDASKDGSSGKSKPKDPKPGDNPKSKDDPSKKDDPNKTDDGKKPEEKDPKDPDGEKSDGSSKGKPNDSGKKPPKSKPKSKPMPGDGQPPMEDQPMPPNSGDEPESPQQSPPSEQEQQRQPERTAGRQELEQARKEMENAIEELKKKSGKASEKQDEALADLLKAKERLEEILRQLREEEKEMVLAALEARLRDMLGRQITVLNGTVGLAAVPEAQRTDKHRNRAVELARNEDEIAVLAAKVLTLLKEEGSSIAFPEALVQLRDDMLTVTRRLERVDVGELTVGIEKDIVESLEEILEALQKELEKAKDKKQQPPQQQQSQQQQEQGLVDILSELKMLRSLQYRVNRRTKQLGRMIEGEQASDPDLRQQLQGLSQRQAKIQQSTYNLAIGRNK